MIAETSSPTVAATARDRPGPGRPATTVPPLPGAVGISRLDVYPDAAIDGVVGGTPHVHLVCSEGYYVIAGSGTVQTVTAGGRHEVALRTGTVAWFTPGAVHRLTNDGDLQILTLMQNSGLPEAGDAVLTMPAAVLADPGEYDRVAQTPSGATLEDAYRRRDLAVQGLEELLTAIDRDGPPALDAFYRSAAAIIRPLLQQWHRLWDDGPRRAAEDTGDQIVALGEGDVAHLLRADVHARPEPVETGRLGMCGLLETYPAAPHEVGVPR
jgi:mannose-6-phosphate isomerase-like protein (cupin superfamily)